MSEDPRSRHILVFPYPAQGHMLALLDLTHLLARRGLTVTIVVTPKNLPAVGPLLSRHPTTVTPLVLPFPKHPSIPDGVENMVELPASGFRVMMLALSGLHAPILEWFEAHPSPPVAIVSDMFLGWTHNLARQLGIRRYAFFPSGASALSYIMRLWEDRPKRADENDGGEIVSFGDRVPGSPSYPWWQVSPIYRSYVEGDPLSEFIRETFLGNQENYGLVFNTFNELESVYLNHFKRKLGHERVWSVGPLLPSNGAEAVRGGGSSSISAEKVRSWLDNCPERSVVYVCFGSQAVLTNEQMLELAQGLETSGVRFVLSVKLGTKKGHADGDHGLDIPVGFEDRVAGRGLVIKGWAPQVLILRHKAVCAFLTHCGWNSTLESVMAGVPMLAWPMGADQYLNATLLVDKFDVAVRVCEGDKTVLSSQKLVKFLKEATSEAWRERRARALKLSKAASDAISDGGSSSNDLDNLAKDIIMSGAE